MSDRAGLLNYHRLLFPSLLSSRARLAGLIFAFFSLSALFPRKVCWLVHRFFLLES
jgi:hypothetical protein